MKEDDESFIEIDAYGKVSKLDKWEYNKTLNVLARNALFTKKTIQFGFWVDRFITAIKIVNIESLPLKKMIKDEEKKIRSNYYDKLDMLKKNIEIWYDDYKRDYYLDIWAEQYWEELFDYGLEVATQAGFTIYLESIDQNIATRG